MSNFMFDQLKRLDKYDSLANRTKKRPMAKPMTINREPQAIENIDQPLNYESWLQTQGPGAGNISPFQSQGTDYWQEQYNDYVMGFNAKFGSNRGMGMPNMGNNSGMGSNSTMRKPGSGGPRDMGTPSMGNLLNGKPNKMY